MPYDTVRPYDPYGAAGINPLVARNYFSGRGPERALRFNQAFLRQVEQARERAAAQTGPPLVPISFTPSGEPIELDIDDPALLVAAQRVVEAGIPLDAPQLGNVIQEIAFDPEVRALFADIGIAPYPISGPTVAPYGDKKEEDLFVSFLSDIGGFIQEAYDFLTPAFGSSTLPVASSIAPIIGEAIPAIGAGIAVASTAGSVMSLFSGGPRSTQEILADARSSRRGATKKKIVSAARHCGIPMAADMFGLDESDVCQLVITPTRRRRGISQSDIRRTRSTIRKVEGIRKSLKSAGICRR